MRVDAMVLKVELAIKGISGEKLPPVCVIYGTSACRDSLPSFLSYIWIFHAPGNYGVHS